MAVGDYTLGELHPVAGIRLATVSAGIKKVGRPDLVVIALEPGGTVAGLYTCNAFRAAPVRVAQRHGCVGSARYLLINTGNANAGTGEAGLEAALQCCRALAEAAGCGSQEVLPFSTGVIGEPLPVDKIVKVLPQALEQLQGAGWADAAAGIMTTDTRPKGASRQLTLGGRRVTITGIAKGAGMIKPNMATMLAFVATDLAVPHEILQSVLRDVTALSFNRITVDGDTSTNDCCLLMASGKSGLAYGDLNEDERRSFRAALAELFRDLARALVKDAEGASKFVTITVEGGVSQAEALQVAYTVAESPLVKTALFASDPNWGRILAAVGRAGLAELDVDRISIWLGEVRIVRDGGRDPDYREELGAAVMGRDEIDIRIHLNRGEQREQVWTCDLGYDYVKINAEYRT